jgi:hypothetical protein
MGKNEQNYGKAIKEDQKAALRLCEVSGGATRQTYDQAVAKAVHASNEMEAARIRYEANPNG